MSMTVPSTPQRALAQALRRAGRFNQDVECAPQCILWPDKDSQWRPIIAALQAELPELLVLGSLDFGHRCGLTTPVPEVWKWPSGCSIESGKRKRVRSERA